MDTIAIDERVIQLLKSQFMSRSSGSTMDPLSDVLSLLKPRNYFSTGLDAGGAWSLRFPTHEGIKFNAVMSGKCWLAVQGLAAPVLLEEGDCFLLTSGRPFQLASDMALAPVDASTIYSGARDGLVQCNGGGDFHLIGSRYGFAGDDPRMLLGILPPVVHVHNGLHQASELRWLLDRIVRELREPQPGSELIADHLAHLMLMQVLRLHLADSDVGRVGWLFALADRRIGAAIGAMHADPAHRWTLNSLAQCANMSRSVFALRFKEAVGMTAIEYLAYWRMSLARNRLQNTRDGIATIALSLGFASESAFCAAFRRVVGSSPRKFSRQKAYIDVPGDEACRV